MRTSIAAVALIARRRSGEVEYLTQWNRDWAAFHLIGGHKRDGETFHECAAREIAEELGLLPDDYSMGPHPVAHLEYVALSRGAGAETSYTVELFEVGARCDKLLDAIEQRSENAWLSTRDIVAGLADDGRAISPTMRLLLSKTARLAVERGPSVFTIGVTGHRDLRRDDDGGLLRRLGEVLDAAEDAAGARPIEVLSPLAAGADQLFAEVAIARGYRLIAPLPLPLDLYRRDFDGESAGAFERLLSRASEWYSLPLGGWPSQAVQEHKTKGHDQGSPARRNCEADAVSRNDIGVFGPARDQMYEAVGRHVVERSDLLLALWDGHTNGKRGGTGEIVAFARRAAAAGQSLRIEVVPARRNDKTT